MLIVLEFYQNFICHDGIGRSLIMGVEIDLDPYHLGEILHLR